LRLLLGKNKKKTLASIPSLRAAAVREVQRAEHTPQRERREEERGEANLSRFAGSEPVIFRTVIGCSNMV
jgi:hypothetical protein